MKYQEIVQQMTEKLRNGEALPGSRLPSLRAVRETFHVSLSVAIQAYQTLEQMGFIRSVPRSGFEWIPQQTPQKLAMAPSKFPVSDPIPSSLIGRIIGMGLDPELAPFAAGIPSPEILPLAKVNKSLQHVIRNKPQLLSEYTPSQGSPRFRHLLAERFARKQIVVQASEIVLTNGAIEALSLAVQACTQPGDLVALESPFFFGVLPILEDLKRKVVEVPHDWTQGLDLAQMERLLRKYPVKALLCSGTVQNPLGTILSLEQQKELYDLCKKYDIAIIEDNVYGECGYSNSLLLPIKRLDKDQRVIYVSSMSKSSAPGLRSGWMLPGRYLDVVTHLKMNHSLGQSILIQEASAYFMANGGYENGLRRFRLSIHRQVMSYRQVILQYFPVETQVTLPQGGFFLWVELPGSVKTQELLSQAIKSKLSYVPGSVFTQGSHFDHCLRISCTQPFSEEIQKALKRLGDFFKSFLESQ